jgi:protein O-GlcNAc transferase
MASAGSEATQAADRLIEAGNLAEREGRLAEACENYRAAVDAAPHHGRAHLNLGIGLEAAGELDAALKAYERALALDAADPYVNYNLAKLLASRGDADRGEALLRAALRSKPALAEAHVVLSNLYEERGRLREAAAELEAALAIRPQYVGALLNYGTVLKKQGRLVEAAACYEKVTALEPQRAEAHWHLGNVVADGGHLDDAAVHLRRALALKPDFVEAQHSLCMIAQAQGKLDAATACLRDLLALHPRFAQAALSLGKLLGRQNRLDEAVAALQRAISLDPRHAEAHLQLGHAHNAQGRTDAALECYGKALAIDTESAEARWAMAMAYLRAVPETDAIATADRTAFSRQLDALDAWVGEARVAASVTAVGNPPPFHLAYQETNNRDLLERYGALCARIMTRWMADERLAGPTTTQRRDRVRVGVVSAHFHDHSVWNALLKGWFQRLDRGRFALEAFYLGTEFDEQTRLAQSMATHFEHEPISLRQWVQAISRRRPDVLIYPEIGMDSMTSRLASLRLAPVQIASWGHPQTSGLPTIDYYVSAQDLEPERAQEHYSERLVLLPHLGCSYPSRRIAPTSVATTGLRIDPAVPTLVCPGTPFKYAPRHDEVFAEIARRLGRCTFVFFTYRIAELSERLHDRLRRLFRERGLDADEFVSFVPWQSPGQFRGLMERAHLFLDTIGFSGFNTAMEAVECALPVVTREGRFMRGRLASGILKRMGLQELVAPTEEAYVELAVRICRDDAYRAHLRERLKAQRNILFDDAAPVQALEQFLARVATP